MKKNCFYFLILTLASSGLTTQGATLIHHYDMETVTNGRPQDISTDTSFTGGSTTSTSVSGGSCGNYLDMSGSTAGLTGGSNSGYAESQGKNMAFSLMFNTGTLPTFSSGSKPDAGQWLFSTKPDAGGNALKFGIGPDGRLTGGVSWQFSLSSANNLVTANTWYQLGVVISGSKFEIYLNGVSVASTDYTGNFDIGTVSTNIASNNQSITEGNYNGKIDEVKVWNEVASQAEGAGLMQNEAARMIPEPGSVMLGLLGLIPLIMRRRRA